MTQTPKQRAVLFDHDGGVDDLLSLMMLLAMPHITLAGVVVTPADCFLRPAVSATQKILRFFGRQDIELSQGNLHGVNPFPRDWRKHAYAIDALPILNELKWGGKSQNLEPDSTGPSITYQLPGMRSASTQDAFKDLKERITNRLVAELDLNVSDMDEARLALEEKFDRILSQENIILSRSERLRLFEEITSDLLGESILPPPVSEPGHKFLARKLKESSTPLTVLITGPVSNLAATLTAEPDLAANVEEVVWMGGALNVPGNVRDYEHDGSAEWNAYWDPPSTYGLWQTGVPITLFPLDATDKVPVTMDFLHQLAQQRRYPLSDLAGQCWALTVGTIPSYEYVYHMWDTLTTGYLGAPQFITFRQVHTKAVPYGPNAGRIKEVSKGGKLIRAADQIDVDGFLNYVLELFRSN